MKVQYQHGAIVTGAEDERSIQSDKVHIEARVDGLEKHRTFTQETGVCFPCETHS